MLQVTVEHADAHITLKLEGKLKGPWVDELERCWLTLASTAPDKPVRVDLTGVGFIAPEGGNLIRKMAGAGVELIASGPTVDVIVNDVRAQNSHIPIRRVG